MGATTADLPVLQPSFCPQQLLLSPQRTRPPLTPSPSSFVPGAGKHLHDIQTTPSRHTNSTFTTYRQIPLRHTDNTFTTYRQTPSRHTNTFTTYRQHLHDIKTNTFTTYKHLHDIQTTYLRHTDKRLHDIKTTSSRYTNTFTKHRQHLHDIQTPSRPTANIFTTYRQHLHDIHFHDIQTNTFTTEPTDRKNKKDILIR